MAVPGDHSRVHQLRVSPKTVRVVAASALVLFIVLAAFTTGFFIKESQRLRAERLAKENALLTEQVATIQGRLESIDGLMTELSRRDRQYRLIAGLKPIDEDVQLAGIGGPGTATLQSNQLWRLDPELGQLTFSTQSSLNALIRRARMLSSSWERATDSLTATYDRWTKLPTIQPADGYVSSGFSQSRWHPILHTARPHEGIDIAAQIGTPIVAAAAGRVTEAGWSGQFGNMVEIRHGHGLVTRYAHASDIFVEEGEWVERGDKIAEIGETGLAAGPHLHYEILRYGRPVNPSEYILNEYVIPD